MHPQINQDEPGSCPICGMELEPVLATASADNENPELRDMNRRFWLAAFFSLRRIDLGVGMERIPGKPECDQGW